MSPVVHNARFGEVTYLSNKWVDDSGTHWFGKVEDEEDRWKTRISLSNHHRKNNLRELVHTHLNAGERRYKTFFN